ncbi:MAG: arsenate reductase (thioredoxin) [Firmicutes bacterium]|nr:arsenate reductase (thioredoxin) [Bacillota bacterium]
MTSEQKQKRVLFLCTGNSARSQMAEGFLKDLGGNQYEVYSAGIAPVGINPMAIMVMDEIGIDISSQTSDAINKELLDKINLLITLCGDARENCPFVPVKVEKRHWPLEDPARVEGSEEEIKAKFREVRDQIKEYVQELISE